MKTLSLKSVNSAEALGELGTEEAVDPLIELLDYENDDGAQQGRICPGSHRRPESCCPSYRSLWQRELGYSVANAVGNLGGEDAVEKILGLLDSRDQNIRINSIYALRSIRDPAAVPYLVEMLGDRDPEVRKEAAFALSFFKEPEEVALTEQPLINALGDKEPEVQKAAVRSLGRIGSKGSVPYLKEFLQDKDKDLRVAASDSLGEIRDPEVVDFLIAALEDEYYRVRQSAAEGLGKLGDKRAVRPLLKALETKRERDVRAAEVRALGKLGGPEAIEGLSRISKDMEEYRNVRDAAEEALKKLERNGELEEGREKTSSPVISQNSTNS